MCSGITLTKNETEDVMKVIRYLDNRIILLKASTRKISTQKGEFLNFLTPLMPVLFTINEKCSYAITKVILIPVGLMAAASTTYQPF